MNEEEATYVTAEGKMRAALEGAKLYIDSRNLPDAHITDRILKQIDDALAKGTTVRSSESEEIEGQIDRAYNAGYKQREAEYGLKAKHVQELISDAYKEGKIDSDNETAIELIELPASIKSQSSAVADLTADIEKLRLSIAVSKNQALELVLSATETEMGKTKPKYGNEQSRKVALESLLKNDKLYLDNCDELGRKESALRKEQIQLDFLHNRFSAYRAIATMQGV